MDNNSPSDPDSHKRVTDSGDDLASCLHVLRRSKAIRWGIRKRVSYLPKKVKVVKSKMSLRGESESESKAGGSSKQGMAESEVGEIVTEVKEISGGKRMREGSSGANERKLRKIPIRWSAERCESAKKWLVEVVREMDATWQKPVLRHYLREKARKHIGDTGLLDHLLKHMAGEVFADGKERLVRRHNTEGAIEYWLEPAELAMVRKEAGITDPYWVPPPGWKPGDDISGGACHGPWKEMVSQCKEEINHLKSEIAELKSLKETDEKAQQEKFQGLLMQHGKLQEQFTAISNSMVSMKKEIFLLKEENENRRKEELAKAVKETNLAGCSGEKHSVQETEKCKKVVEGDKASTKEKTTRKSGSRICRPDGTFLLPSMTSAGGYSPHSMSLPPQPILLPSPTSPLPPPRPAFFFHQQPDSQRQVQSISPTQSQVAIVQSPIQVTAHRPTARYPSHGMMVSGSSSRVDREEKRNDAVTDLALASFKVPSMPSRLTRDERPMWECTYAVRFGRGLLAQYNMRAVGGLDMSVVRNRKTAFQET